MKIKFCMSTCRFCRSVWTSEDKKIHFLIMEEYLANFIKSFIEMNYNMACLNNFYNNTHIKQD